MAGDRIVKEWRQKPLICTLLATKKNFIKITVRKNNELMCFKITNFKLHLKNRE